MKKLAMTCLLILSIFFTVGCVEREKPELVIVSQFGSAVSEQELYRDELFAPFEEEHGVSIRFESMDHQSAYSKIEVEQSAETYTVDLVISHYGVMTEYLEAGFIMNANDLEADMDDRTFITAFDSNTNMDGNRHYFPINADVYIAIANKDAFDYLPEGLTEEAVLEGNYTWDDYVAWGNNIEGTKVFMKALPNSQLLYQIGGMALSHGGMYPVMNDAGNIKAWQHVLAMKDSIHPESINNSSAEQLLGDNSVFLAFEHMAVVAATYSVAPAKYHVFPGPIGDDGKAGSIAGGHGIGIVENAPNQELAEEFIKFMTSPEKIRYASLGTIPTIEEAELGDNPEDLVLAFGLNTIANANVEGLQMIPEYTSWSAVKEIYDRVYQGIMEGTITEVNLVATLNDEQDNLEDLLVE